MDVADLVDGIYRLLMSEEHLPTNIGNPREMSIREFAEIVNAITGNPGGLRFVTEGRTQGDPQQRRPDITKARTLLGWEPKVELEDGLRTTIDYFRGVIGKS